MAAKTQKNIALKKKHPGGRPSKLTPQLAVKIFFMARRGFTDLEIAEVLDLTEQTINNWKKIPEFFEALKENKAEADELVELSLFERAVGYSHPEEKVFQYEGEIITHETIKHYPPEPVACFFWLKNRKPKEWRDRIEHAVNGELKLSPPERDKKLGNLRQNLIED